MITITSRATIDHLMRSLQERFENLDRVARGRDLKNEKEGCKGRTHWIEPEKMTAIEKEKLEIAVDDFKTVLSQLRKAK